MDPGEMILSDYVDMVNRRKWSLAIPLVIISLLAVLIALLWPPSYQSSATILIEEQDIPTDFVAATVTTFAEQRIEATRQRLMTYDNLWEIIERFDLYADERKRRTNDEVVDKMRDDIRFRLNTAEVLDRRTGRSMTATITFNLSYEAKESPKKVGQVANRLVSLFLEENYRVRERQAAEASSFLEQELERVKSDMSRIDTQIAEFKESNINELPDLLTVNMQTLNNVEQMIERLYEQLRSLKEREGYLQTQLAGIPPAGETVKDKELLERLKQERIALKARYTDDYPDVIEINANIAEIEAKLARADTQPQKGSADNDNPAYVALASQLASTQAEIAAIRRQIREFENRREEQQRRIEMTPKVEETYMALLIERENMHAKYNDLMLKAMEAKVAQGLEKEQKGERFTLIDPPREPEKPSKPNRLAIVLIGIVLGCGAGVGWASLREFTDQTVRKAESLTAATDFPVLATLSNILTEADIQRKRLHRRIAVAATLGAAIIVVITFHFFIMDLDILWAKIIRKLWI